MDAFARQSRLVDEAGASRLFERRRQRAIFRTVGAGQSGDPAQVVLGLLAVALFELPQPVILPGSHMVRVGFQRALIPDLRDLVVAELAIGIADQIGDIGAVVMAERLQLVNGGGVVIAVVDRGVGRVIAGEKFGIVKTRTLVALFLAVLGRARRR